MLKVKWINCNGHEGSVLPHFSTKLRVKFLPVRQTFRAQFFKSSIFVCIHELKTRKNIQIHEDLPHCIFWYIAVSKQHSDYHWDSVQCT